MKKGLIIIGVAVLAIVAYFVIAENKDQDEPEANKPVARTGKAHSQSFNANTAGMMQDYYKLKAALVAWDTPGINTAIATLVKSMDNVVLDSASTGNTAFNKTKTHAGTLMQAVGIENQRKAFSSLSVSLFTFLQEEEYSAGKVYKQECPMAFYDTVAAWWLSDNSEIINPYLGMQHPRYKNAMLHCGEVKDSVAFAALP